MIKLDKEKLVCASCKEGVGRQGVTFHCPQCSKREMARCLKCRRISSSY